MGNVPSTEAVNRRKSPQGKKRSIPYNRNSSARMSKNDKRVQEIELNVKELRRAIESYTGVRGTPTYKALHMQLSKKGQEVQELSTKATKPERQDTYKNIQHEISSLFKILEEVVERNERYLDSAAVESHSFIDQTPKMRVKELRSQKSIDTDIDNLEEINRRVTILGEEIDNAITLEDKSRYKILEQKLNMLYSDLSQIDDHGKKFIDSKESINKSLMRQAKKLQNIKEPRPLSMSRRQSQEDLSKKTQKERQIGNKIEEDLGDIEVKVMTFEDLKTDAKYRELDQLLKGHWATLSNLSDSSEENRRRKLKTIDLIKRMLQELSKRADENSTKIHSALDKINDVEDDVVALKNSVEKFWGLKNDVEYNSLDQKLRSLWAKLNDIHNTYEAVVKRKEETIEAIQNLLRTLLKNAEKNDKNTIYGNREILQAQSSFTNNGDIPHKAPLATPREAKSFLLEDLEQFENKWVTLDKSITSHLQQEEIKQITQILKNLQDNIGRRYKELNAKLLQKSSSSDNLRRKVVDEPTVQKVTVLEKNLEQKRSVIGQFLNNRNSKNFSPEEQLISELTNDRSMIKLNTIEHDLELAKKKILSNPENINEIRNELERLQNEMKHLQTNVNPAVVAKREHVFGTLMSTFELLEKGTKAKRDKSEDTTKLKSLLEAVQKLKKKVDCFSGTYKNIQYVQIENGLLNCLQELETVHSDSEKILTTKNQLKHKIERYLKILDERSLKVSSEEDLADDEPEVFSQKAKAIVIKLTEIRSILETFEGGENAGPISKDISECDRMIRKLKPKTQEERSIQDQYKDYLEKLILYFNSKLDQPDISTPTKALMQCENDLTELKSKVSIFNAIENDSDFEKTQLELDDLAGRIDVVVPSLPGDKEFKNNLQRDIQSLTGLLKTKRRASKRMSQYNEQLNQVKLEEIQEGIGKLSDEVHNFSAKNYRERYDQLDESMANMFLKIQGLDIDSSMRDYLIRQIQSHKKILKQKLDAITFDIPDKKGTEV